MPNHRRRPLALVKTYRSNGYEMDFSHLKDRVKNLGFAEAFGQLRWIAKGKDLELSREHRIRLEQLVEEEAYTSPHYDWSALAICRYNYIDGDLVRKIEWEGMIKKLDFMLGVLREEVPRTPGWEMYKACEIVDWTPTEQEIIELIQNSFLAEGSGGSKRRGCFNEYDR